jgi:hypothetical protein
MLSVFSVFSLDFLALECLSNGSSRNVYFTTVYMWCITPILLAFLIVAAGLVRYLNLKAFHSSSSYLHHMVEGRKIINQHVWLLLFLSYLVLPPVSNKQLQVYDCIELNGNERYLRSDTSIDCRSDEYVSFSRIVLSFIGVYQLVPITWFILLTRNQHALYSPNLKHDEVLAVYVRDNNPSLAPLRFLFVDYKCSKWWFEIADMYRRIVFIGIVPLVSPQPAVRASFGVLLAILSTAYIREERPYKIEFTNVVAHIAQVE